MTEQNSNPTEISTLHNDVDSNGIPILNDVVEESTEVEEQPITTEDTATTSNTSDSITSQPTEIDNLKEALREELSNELNELIQSTLIKTAKEISPHVEKIIERKLSDTLQKQMGELLKIALEEQFKNNKSK